MVAMPQAVLLDDGVTDEFDDGTTDTHIHTHKHAYFDDDNNAGDGCCCCSSYIFCCDCHAFLHFFCSSNSSRCNFSILK